MLLSMDGALSLWLWADGPRLWFWPIYSGQLWGTPPDPYLTYSSQTCE